MEDLLVQEDWHPPVYVITGDPCEGKTGFLMKVLAGLNRENLKIRGFVAPGRFTDNVRSGFSLIDLSTGESEELCSSARYPECRQFGRFYFRKEGLSFGYRALSPLRAGGDTDLLVIDEIGLFELKGEVWSRCLDRIVSMPHPPMIWTVRRSLLDAIGRRWPVRRQIVIELDHVSPETWSCEIKKEIAIFRSQQRLKR